jgi:hypothetical protein
MTSRIGISESLLLAVGVFDVRRSGHGNEALFRACQMAKVVPFQKMVSHVVGVPTVFNAVMPESLRWHLASATFLPDLRDARPRF